MERIKLVGLGRSILAQVLQYVIPGEYVTVTAQMKHALINRMESNVRIVGSFQIHVDILPGVIIVTNFVIQGEFELKLKILFKPPFGQNNPNYSHHC